MKKLNSKGFTAVEGILIFVVVVLIAGVGYYVYNQSQKKDETSQPQSSTTTQTTDTEDNGSKSAQEKSVTKSYSYKGITVSFTMPKSWSSEGIEGYPGSDEYNVYVKNADSDAELSLQIMDYTGSTSSKDKVLDSFTGLDNKPYYIQVGVDDKSGDNKYESLGISACEAKFCMTPINDKYELNAHIIPKSSTVKYPSDAITEIKEIFSSIKIKT